MRVSMRRYANFVWDCCEKMGEQEKQVMDSLSPTLRSNLCLHIYGAALARCPFLSWIGEDEEAMKKLCLSVQSQFLEANDLLFSYGEMNTTVFILLHGWVTLCIGGFFTDDDSG